MRNVEPAEPGPEPRALGARAEVGLDPRHLGRVEASQERGGRKERDPCRRELDRERKTVEPEADLCDRGRVRARELEVGR